MKAIEMIRLARWLMDEDHHAFEQAVTVLRWATELEPGRFDAQCLLAHALVKTGGDEEARAILEKLEPAEEPEMLAVWALACAACFDMKGAMTAIGRALEVDPEDWRLYANRGLVHFNAGDYDQAAADLVRASLLGPLHFSRWELERTLGVGDFRILFAGFKKIRDEVGASAAFGLIDAWIHLWNGEPDKALALLNKLPAGEKTRWEVLALKASCVRAKSKIGSTDGLKREAKLVLEALAKNPDDLALLVRSTKVFGLKTPEDELAAYVKILRSAPDWWEALVHVTRMALHMRRPFFALPYAERAVELFPESPDALRDRARVYSKTGRVADAIADYDTLVASYEAAPQANAPDSEEDEAEETPDYSGDVDEDDEDDDDEEDEDDDEYDDPEANERERIWELRHLYSSRAIARLRARDIEGARADHDRAVALADQQDPWCFLERSRLRAILKERKAAIEDLDAALERVQRDIWIKRRARLKEKLGDKRGAARDWKLIEKLAATAAKAARDFARKKKG